MRIVTVKKDNSPYVIFATSYSPNEAKLIDKCWELSGHSYIADPLPVDQCLVIEYNELPKYFKLLFKVEYTDVEYEDYIREFW